MDQFDAGGPFGLEVPAEVLFAAKLFTAIEDENEIENESIISARELDSLIELCLAYACEKRFSRRRFVAAKRAVLEHWKRNHAALCAQLALTSHDFDRLFAGLLRIVECVRRNWTNYVDLEAGSDNNYPNRLKRELIRQAKIGEKLADRIFAHILRSKLRISIFADRDSSNTRFATGNRLISIRWRIDVVICDRTLSKIMEPIVRLQLIYGNGACGDGDGVDGVDRKMANFEIRLPIFHRLRFMVACALKECAALENRLHLSSGSTST